MPFDTIGAFRSGDIHIHYALVGSTWHMYCCQLGNRLASAGSNDFAVTASDHESGTVCDMERDGHAVYADWHYGSGNRIATASDGGDPGCDEANFPSTSKAERVEVCEVWLKPKPDAKCSGRDNL